MMQETKYQGILRTKEEVDEYEMMWHNRVYKPAIDQLEQQVQ